VKLCIPVEEDLGLESPVCAHFGSAPYFMLVDAESGAHHLVVNRNAHHEHGRCAPLAALAGERVDGWIVGGIGMGALRKLEAASARVFRAEQRTVAANLAALAAGALRPVDPGTACAGHGHDHE
jgi:predicted Fe-Mo cluster-binding NifX family protein